MPAPASEEYRSTGPASAGTSFAASSAVLSERDQIALMESSGEARAAGFGYILASRSRKDIRFFISSFLIASVLYYVYGTDIPLTMCCSLTKMPPPMIAMPTGSIFISISFELEVIGEI